MSEEVGIKGQGTEKEIILSLRNINKSYKQGVTELHVLKDISLEMKKGEVVALVGPSGCGKSTLLQIAGLLDKADSGEISIDGQECSRLFDKKRTAIRKKKLGFVYQFHHLLPDFSAIENVVIPQVINGVPEARARIKAKDQLEKLGLAERLNHRPSQLSGGEQQRVAIARALANDPVLLMADEPTGNLDPETSDSVFEMLVWQAREAELSLLIVTHNMDLAGRTDRKIVIG